MTDAVKALREKLRSWYGARLTDELDSLVTAVEREMNALQSRLDEARKLAERWRWAASLNTELPGSKAQQSGWSQCADELLAVLDREEA